ncbi:hypothetical protein J4414_02935 [Candidatus Woesearchaeota archaeon]|nr:hypothetical protein [Candidatus Woesearchaeota archaeon]
MKGKIDKDDLGYIELCYMNEPKTGKVIFIIPSKNKFYLYKVLVEDLKNKNIRRRRFFTPPRFDILGNVEEYKFLEQVEAEISRKMEFDRSLCVSFVYEEINLFNTSEKNLEYKLDIAALLYAHFKEEYNSHNNDKR